MSEKNGKNCWATVETQNTKSNWHAASGHKSEEGRRIRLNTSEKSIRLDRIRWIDTTELLNANKFYAIPTATREMVKPLKIEIDSCGLSSDGWILWRYVILSETTFPWCIKYCQQD